VQDLGMVQAADRGSHTLSCTVQVVRQGADHLTRQDLMMNLPPRELLELSRYSGSIQSGSGWAPRRTPDSAFPRYVPDGAVSRGYREELCVVR
jgi:hypothetical protein